jgi:tetratricopeptide (TPR) repeat protein
MASMLDALDASCERDRRWIAALFVFAFLVKLAYVLQSSGSISFKVPILDARFYDDTAQSIAAGRGVQGGVFFMGPLYSYFLAVLYGIFGRSITLVRSIQALGGSITVVLAFLIGKRVFRPSAALVGALMLALYGAATFYDGQLLMEWLGTLLDMLLLFVIYRDFGEKHALKFALAGFLLGLSALARASILVFAPVVLVWILFVEKERGRIASAVVFVVAALVTISPATIHNYAAARDRVLITSNGGLNFYIGNNEAATGAYTPPPGVDLASDMTSARRVQELTGRDMKPSEVSRYWSREAMKWIARHPGAELRLLLRKTALFCNAFETPQIESYDLSRGEYGIFRLLRVNFWMLCSLGIVGMIYSRRVWRRSFLLAWFVISYSLSIILFFVTARYRVQIAPPLALFAAYAAVEVIPSSFGRGVRALVPLALFGALLYLTRPGLFPFDEDYIRWREHIHEGRRWSTLGREDRALAEVNAAVALRPRDPESYAQRAVVYANAGESTNAIDDYRRALAIAPALPRAHYDLAQELRKERAYPAAVEEYLKAIERDSLMVEAYNNLGITYQLMKDYEGALRGFRKAIRLDPGYVRAYNNLGAALAESGDLAGAISSFSEAIRRDPGYPNSYKNLAIALMQERKLPEARRVLESYLRLAPGDASAKQILRDISSAALADTTGSPVPHR